MTSSGEAGIVKGERLLRREVAAVLAFKLVAITLLWYFFFGSAHTVVVTPSKVDAKLFTAPASKPVPHPGS